MEAQGAEATQGSQRIFIARLIVGLAQGLVLYLLYYAHESKIWPATDPNLFAPALLVGMFVPLLILQALDNVRKRVLIIWTALATAIAAGFAWYDVWHAWPAVMPVVDGHSIAVAYVLPSATVVIFTAVFLFVAHALISCIETDRRFVPRYSVLFDVAWKLGVQLGIALCFVVAFWILIYLGVALFEMIKLHFFREFVQHTWFSIPVTALATAVAIHITDTRATLVRGVRTLALMLLGWLLPVIALIAFAFLISLVFTGLKPLWETRTATGLLLAATAVLVIHINAVYQDGDEEHRPHHALRVAGTLASILLIFLVAIATYALWLRVDQYGWTVDRIDTAMVTLVAICFAVGYFIAALLPGKWLKLIETWNFFTTILGLIILFALFTPIADPMRISVDSQMTRLQSGKVKPDKFDFWYLRNDGGRFGRAALEALRTSPEAAVRAAVEAPLTRGPIPFGTDHLGELAKVVTVHPKGAVLPASFLSGKWDNGELQPADLPSGCHEQGGSCDAVLVDLNGDGRNEIIFIYTNRAAGNGWWTASVYQEGSNGWRPVAGLSDPGCKGYREGLLEGRFKLVPPAHVWPDIEVNGNRGAVSEYSAVKPATPCK